LRLSRPRSKLKAYRLKFADPQHRRKDPAIHDQPQTKIAGDGQVPSPAFRRNPDRSLEKLS
jgi:hypothetical protein